MHIASNDPAQNPFDIALTGTGITDLEAFRLQYFGSTANSGNGADANDFDLDEFQTSWSLRPGLIQRRVMQRPEC